MYSIGGVKYSKYYVRIKITFYNNQFKSDSEPNLIQACTEKHK